LTVTTRNLPLDVDAVNITRVARAKGRTTR
jgi:hypothetical protein